MIRPGLFTLLFVYCVLVVLWLATFAMAGAAVDPAWHLPIALAISTLKTLLIAMFFMHLYYGPPLNRVVACAGVFWLTILMGLALCDFLSRAPTDNGASESLSSPSRRGSENLGTSSPATLNGR